MPFFRVPFFAPPFFFHSLFSPSGLCGSTKSPEWSPQKCHVALSLSARDRPERPVTQIPQRPLSFCRRGSGLSRNERAPQLWETLGNNSLPVLTEKWATHPVSSFWRKPQGRVCSLSRRKKHSRTCVSEDTHTYTHTTHTPTNTTSPHTHVTHIRHTDCPSRGHPVLKSPVHHRNSKNSHASVSQITPRFLFPFEGNKNLEGPQ